MESALVPSALRERLGLEATGGLVQFMDDAHEEWTEQVVTVCLDRFDRRLVQEVAGVRTLIADTTAKLREEHSQTQLAVMRELGVIRQDIAHNRVEFLKWSFLFWVGQFFAVGGVLTVLSDQ